MRARGVAIHAPCGPVHTPTPSTLQAVGGRGHDRVKCHRCVTLTRCRGRIAVQGLARVAENVLSYHQSRAGSMAQFLTSDHSVTTPQVRQSP